MTLCEMLKKLQIDKISGYVIDIGGCARPIRESIKECRYIMES